MLGFFLLLGFAIYRLALATLPAFDYSLSLLQWSLLLGNIGFMAYSEGYKGFQLHYSPRFAARLRHLYLQPSLIKALLAPLFCMGYFAATTKRLRVTYILTVMIIALVIVFRLLPQPWRGILDAGVVVGLSWGIIATIYWCYRGLTDPQFDIDPEVGEQQAVSTSASDTHIVSDVLSSK